MGFRSVLSEEFPNLTVTSAVEIDDEPEASYTATMKALHNEPQLLGIYCVGAGHSGVAQGAAGSQAAARSRCSSATI